MASKDILSKCSHENHSSVLVWLIWSDGGNCALRSWHFKKEQGHIPAVASKSNVVRWAHGNGLPPQDHSSRHYGIHFSYHVILFHFREVRDHVRLCLYILLTSWLSNTRLQAVPFSSNAALHTRQQKETEEARQATQRRQVAFATVTGQIWVSREKSASQEQCRHTSQEICLPHSLGRKSRPGSFHYSPDLDLMISLNSFCPSSGLASRSPYLAILTEVQCNPKASPNLLLQIVSSEEWSSLAWIPKRKREKID